MKFTISSSLLSSSLQSIGKVINSRNSLPILECFLFNVNNNRLTIIASDGEIFIEKDLDIISNIETSFAITAKSLIDAIKEIPNQDIVFKINQTINISKNIIIYYNNNKGKYDLMSRYEKDFPSVIYNKDSLTNSFILESNKLIEYISSTLFATSNDELRPICNGIYFDLHNNLNLVATDSHKLVLINLNIPDELVINCDNKSFILHSKTANLIRNIFNKTDEIVNISFDFKRCYFKTSDYRINCRLIEGNYPNYNAVIPINNQLKVILNRNEIISTLRRISCFVDNTNKLIKFKLEKNNLTISAQNFDYSTSAEESIDCIYNNKDIIIGFNISNLLDSLNNISTEEISIELSDHTKAGLIKPIEENCNKKILIMPMMLND